MSCSKRADLQGIRGLAILAVLLFHFFPKYFPNGYVGVDQFFVLSGFLISMILSRSDVTWEGMYMFYYRRIKRIVPMYLFVIVVVLISLFTVFPHTNLQLNIQSASYALLFCTNIKEPSDENMYEIELKLAKDVFTHTWSLAVEMQFYLLVPFIFLVGRDRLWKMLLAVAVTSLGFHLWADDNTSFNHVLARLWQFSIGAMVYLMCDNTERIHENKTFVLLSDDEKEKSKTGFISSPDNYSSSTITLTNVLLVLSFLPQLYSMTVPDTLLRVSSTFITAIAILVGGNIKLWLLNNKFFTYMGDISYALYLVHWPIYTYIKLVHPHSTSALLLGLVASIVLGCLLTETFEKFYLSLDGKWIVILLGVMYSVNLVMICNEEAISELVSSTREVKLLQQQLGARNYRNVSREDVLKLNTFWMEHDIHDDLSLWFDHCDWRTHGDKIRGCDFNDSQNRSGLSVMIIGNSYAANFASTLNEECKDRTSAVSLSWRPSCEILVAHDIGKKRKIDCTSRDPFYISQMKARKPDVLYIINKYNALMKPLSNVNITLDRMFLEAQERLNVYQQFVRKRIYILDAMQEPNLAGPSILMAALKSGNMPTHASLKAWIAYEAARERLHALMSTCKKCRLIDLLPTFTKDGEQTMFDEDSGLLYYNSGTHFTPRALNLLRPLLHDTCHSLMEY